MADSNEQPGSKGASGPERMGGAPPEEEGPESGTQDTGGQTEAAEEPDGEDGRASAGGRRRGGAWLGLLALLVALGVGGAGVHFYRQLDQRLADVDNTLSNREQQQEQLRQELSDKLDEATRGLHSTVEQTKQEQSQLSQGQESLRNRLEQESHTLQTLRKTTRDLQARLKAGPTYWRLERIETLLVNADRIAQLQGDPDAAYAALKSADQALRDLNSPGWMKVRKSVQAAMTKLEQVPRTDLAGIAFKLSSLADSAGDLPVKGVNPPAMGPSQEGQNKEAEQGPPQGWWGRILAGLDAFWQDVKSLVRLRRSGKEVEPLLPPDKATFLRQNLVMDLQYARLAALQHRDKLYHQALKESRGWVKQYFDPESSQVKAVLGSLDDLGKRQVSHELPSLDKPLTVFRQVRQERGK